MGRPKGYKMSEEAKARISAATRARIAAKRAASGTLATEQMSKVYQDILKAKKAFWEGSEPKKKWWEFWK